MFETQTISPSGDIIRSKDVEEMTGHFLMFNHMLKTIDEPLSEELIKKFHHYLKVGVFEDMANGYPCGEYKSRRNMVSVIEVALPEEVPEKMKKLIENYNSKEKHTLEDLARLHADYEKIHPFQDGNGRTGRIILFRECIRNDIFPLIIHNENKAIYNNCLMEQQVNDSIMGLLGFFEKEQEDYYNTVKDMIK